MTTPNLANEYVSIWQIALDVRLQQPTIGRWVRQWLQVDHKVGYGKRPGTGYRIPFGYLLLARAWAQTEDLNVRQATLKVLPYAPAPFVVVVGKVATPVYDVDEAIGMVDVSLRADPPESPAQVIYVGPMALPPPTTEGR